MANNSNTPPTTPSKIPRLKGTPTSIRTPSKTYRHVELPQKDKSERCIFCGKNQTVAYRRKLVNCGAKTESCHKLEEFLGHDIETVSHIVCRLCFSSVSNCLTKIDKLKSLFNGTQSFLRDTFGKNVSKRLVTESPAKREKKRSKMPQADDADKENIYTKGDDDLGVAPLDPVMSVLQIHTSAPRMKSTYVQTASEFPSENFDILVCVLLITFIFNTWSAPKLPILCKYGNFLSLQIYSIQNLLIIDLYIKVPLHLGHFNFIPWMINAPMGRWTLRHKI